METRQRRAKQLEGLLTDAKARLEEHVIHHRILDLDEKTSLERKVELYSRKLEMLNQIPDDYEIERILQRERDRDVRVQKRREWHQQQEQKDGSKPPKIYSQSSSSSSLFDSEEMVDEL